MPHADIGDRRLHYIRRGTGAPLLLIQGMAGHHGMWGEPFLSLLAQDFDVVAFDHRGIASSDRVDAPFTIADLADDAAALMAAIGWTDAHILGISMGGMVAQELAVTHPDRVKTLTLGCTYAGPEGGSLDSPGPLRMMTAMADGDVEKVMRAGYEANLSPGFRMDESRYPEFVDTVTAHRVPTPVVRLQLRACVAHDTVSRLPEIKAPTLIIHGTEDEMITPMNGDHIATLIPDATLETMEGVGHLFWWEHPERTATLIRTHAA